MCLPCTRISITVIHFQGTFDYFAISLFDRSKCGSKTTGTGRRVVFTNRVSTPKRRRHPKRLEKEQEINKELPWSFVALVHVELVSPVFVVPASAKQFSLSLERVTTMPVCLTSSFTFNASARLVENFRIIGTLIPPPLRQRPLGSSNGGPQTLLKVKSMHKFCFPCFS